MGRKKRKVDSAFEEATEDTEEAPVAAVTSTVAASANPKTNVEIKEESLPAKSGYAVTSHSGEIIQEDVYISDGSVDTEDEDGIEVLLVGSRMGIMRRGLHQLTMLQQPNRQWTRQAAADGSATDGVMADRSTVELTEEEKRRQEEEELAKLDPAQRSARLFQEKQRKLEEAKEEARQKENEENAARDVTLFSKRTAFDIRFDSMDEKPWIRSGDLSDFFNYGMAEDDWLEYAQQQLIVRQELIDSSRQKRPPDPTIIPVQPRMAGISAIEHHPDSDEAKVENHDISGRTDVNDTGTGTSVIGPTIKIEGTGVEPVSDSLVSNKEDEENFDDPYENVEGGAWGAVAPPDSLLAKLIQEQEQVSESTKQKATEAANQSNNSQQQTSSLAKEKSDSDSTMDNLSSDEESVDRKKSERHTKSDYDQHHISPQQYKNSFHGRSHYDYPEDPRDRRDAYYGGSRGGWQQPEDPRDRRTAPQGGWQQPSISHHDYYPPPALAHHHHPPPIPLPPPPPPQHVGPPRGPGGRFPNSERGRGGGRGPWDGGRADNSWKRQREGVDPRWRR